ncbi:hypothetical protein C8Q74DRAFT_8425 [Fomes fomentarius]|nr:hypothetical protein C8Q74DRAFT_8425 [Fomes fomentarius]
MLLRSPPPIAIVLETPRRQVGLNYAIPPDFPGFHSPPFIDRLSIVEDNPPHRNRCTLSGDVRGQRRFQARMYMDSVYDIEGSVSAFERNPELSTLTVGKSSSLYSVHSWNQRNAWLFFLTRSLWDLTRLELLRSSSLQVKVGFASWFLECYKPARGGGPDGQQDDGEVVLAPRKPLALAWELPGELAEAAGELSGLKKILSGTTEEGAKVWVHRLEIYGLPDAKKPPLQDGLGEISAGVVEGETALSSLLRDLREMVDELVVFDSSIVVSIPLR